MTAVRRRRALRATASWLAAFLLVLTAFASLAPEPARAATASITINKHVCYGQVNGNIYDMAAVCGGSDEVFTFNLYFGGAPPIATTSTSNSLASFSGLDVGTYYVEEVPSPNFDAALVWCKIDDFSGQPVQELLAYEDFNWQIEVNIATDGNMVFCDWFNYNVNAPAPTGSVIVNKIVCPADYIEARTADIYGIAANCHETPPPVNFTLIDSGGNASTMTTATSPPYQVEWPDIAPGDLSIAEEIPAGYGAPRVFCKNDNLTAEGDAEEEAPVSGNGITYTFKPGYDLVWCDWVNIPELGVTIYINKHRCPDGYQSDDIYELAANCHETYDPFRFEVSGAETGAGGSQETGESVPGAVQFTGLAADTWTVVEDLPERYREPGVFCKVINDADGTETSQDRAEIEQRSAISYDIGAGQTLWCDWFNLAEAPPTPTPTSTPTPRPAEPGGPVTTPTARPTGPATLTIVKYTCPDDYDPLAHGANPERDCDEPDDGVAFALTGAQGSSVDGETGEDEPGRVTFANLRAGSYLIQETFPEGVANAFIWSCRSSGRDFTYPFSPFARIGPTGAIRITLIAGETLTCEWYNVPSSVSPGGEVPVRLTVYDCPSQTVNSASCDPAADGTQIRFESLDSGETETLRTDGDGEVSGALPAGEYDLDADRTICFGESTAATPDGTLLLEGTEEISVTLYLCAS